jgi:signal transduction histidine kinase
MATQGALTYFIRFRDKVWHLYKRFIYTGIDDSMSAQSAKHILLTNSINATTLTIIIPYSVLFYILGLKLLAVILLAIFILFLFYYYLSYRRQYFLSRMLMVISMNIALGIYGVLLGKESGLHALFFVFFTLPFLLFSMRHKLPIFICALSSLIPFFIIRFGVIPVAIPLSNFKLQLLSNSIVSITFLWLLLNKVYLLNATKLVEAALAQKNAELQNEVQLRKFAEQNLTETNALLKLRNRELEQFAYVTSHDLQEPLRTIVNYAELLEAKYAKDLDEKGTHYVQIMHASSVRLQKLIKDLLDYNRVGRDYNLEAINTTALVKEVIDDLVAMIEESAAQIEVGRLPVVSASPTEFKLLIQNLVANAIKFRRPDVPCVVSVNATDENDYWRFSVADNGIGIEEKFVSRIFIIFQRLHTYKEYSGNGIGLAHCKKIVEMHGGRIWCEPEVNKGSIFYFTIPKS